MVLHKRQDVFDCNSQSLFDHRHVCKFLERHKKFLNPEETIKVFIMQRKFRLAIQYLIETGEHFVIDYFTMALESNAYDIAFYLYSNYEEDINSEYQKSIHSLVQSYWVSNKLLKAKLHMTKTLLPIFTFNGAKQFIRVLEVKIYESSLENNLFSHSSNPLLCMCLLYEFLVLLK